MKSKPELRNYSCNNFSNLHLPLIELISLEKAESTEKVARMNEVIFTTKGVSRVESSLYPDYILDKDSALFVPTGCNYQLTSVEDSTWVIIRVEPFQNVNGSFFTTNLSQKIPAQTKDEKTGIIQVKPVLKLYLEHLVTYIQDGFNENGFYEIKITELILVLSQYYPVKELVVFFKPVLNKDIDFKIFVLNNWQQIRNVQEFVLLSSYQESSFNRKFKQIFGTSPYKWLNEKRSERIYQEIIHTHKPFKLIAEDNQFKSQQHFNEYCLRYFKLSPGNIRKNGS